ncbi:MAG: hypothetical protein WCO96_01135 [Actinomycetes bacterium]|jgi:hypothetical protein
MPAKKESLYHWALDVMCNGDVPAIVPTIDEDGNINGLYGVAIHPQVGTQLRSSIHSPSKGERCAAAIAAVALCRQSARDDNFDTP